MRRPSASPPGIPGELADADRRGCRGSRAGTATGPEIIAGPDASTRIAAVDADVVLNGITGSIGLAPTLAALKSGATLALANKESLIVGGALVKAAARDGPDRSRGLRALRHRPVPALRFSAAKWTSSS